MQPTIHWLLAIILAFSLTVPLIASEPLVKLDPSDGHTLVNEGTATTININSPRGIGRTTVRPAGDAWPEKIVIRLHLRGLEGLQLRGKTATYSTGFTSSDGGRALRTERRQNVDGAKQEILPVDHPDSIKIRRVSKKGEPKIPLDGFFEVHIPAKLLKDSPESFQLHWIDFYR